MYMLRRARRFLFDPWTIKTGADRLTVELTFRRWHPAFWLFMAGCFLRALRSVRVEVGP